MILLRLAHNASYVLVERRRCTALITLGRYVENVLADRIADAVEDRLRRQHRGEPTLFRREVGVCLGEGRIDVAAINGAITAVEVKSASDSLTRLPRQVELYGRVADLAVLAVERRHPDRVLGLLPAWWGVWHVVEDGDQVRLDVLREPLHNRLVDPLSVAQLLWRNEALEELRQRDLHRGLVSATRWRLWETLVRELPVEELATVVRERLRARQGW